MGMASDGGAKVVLVALSGALGHPSSPSLPPLVADKMWGARYLGCHLGPHECRQSQQHPAAP